MLPCVSEAELQNWGPSSKSDAQRVSGSELIIFFFCEIQIRGRRSGGFFKPQD